MKNGFFVLVTVLFLWGCAHPERQVASVGAIGAPRVEVQIVRRGPFDEVQSPEFSGFLFRPEAQVASVTWVPTLDQVFEAEKHFERYIRDSNPEVYIHIRDYRRQYFGYGADVARRIHAYFSCSKTEDLSDPGAESKALETSDCHFSLNFELPNRKVTGYRPPESGTENLEDSDL